MKTEGCVGVDEEEEIGGISMGTMKKKVDPTPSFVSIAHEMHEVATDAQPQPAASALQIARTPTFEEEEKEGERHRELNAKINNKKQLSW